MGKRSIRLVAVSDDTAKRVENLAKSMGIKVNELAGILLRSLLNLLPDGDTVRLFLTVSRIVSSASRLGLAPVPLTALARLISVLDDEKVYRLALEASRSIAVLAASLRLTHGDVRVIDLLQSIMPGVSIDVEEEDGRGRAVIASQHLADRKLRVVVRNIAETALMSLGYRVLDAVDVGEGVIALTYSR